MAAVVSLQHRNVLGQALVPCCQEPVTGFYRDGFCRIGPEDVGLHAVCCVVTEEFLVYLQRRGNDLITPRPEFHFAGLRPGSRWCVCVRSWAEALEVGVACPVVLEATDASVLQYVSLADLTRHAYRADAPPAPSPSPTL